MHDLVGESMLIMERCNFKLRLSKAGWRADRLAVVQPDKKL